MKHLFNASVSFERSQGVQVKVDCASGELARIITLRISKKYIEEPRTVLMCWNVVYPFVCNAESNQVVH